MAQSQDSRGAAWERWVLLGIFAVFLLINLATASRSPTVWTDEAMFVDPAASLYFGHGFHSAGWMHLSKEQPWTFNNLLYEGLLVGWMQIFGFGPAAERSLNYALMIVAVALICAAAKRSGIVAAASDRILLACLLLCGYGITFCYRSARPDIACVVTLGAAFYFWTIRSPLLRQVLLLLTGVVMVWAGVQLIPLTATLALLLLVFVSPRLWTAIAAVACGEAIGAVGLYLIFRAFGQWDAFLYASRYAFEWGHTSRASSEVNILHRIVVAGIDTLKAAAVKDPSSGLVLAGLLVSAFVAALKGGFRWRSAALFGIACAICLPYPMLFSGHYPGYYASMIYVPLAVAAAAAWGMVRHDAGRSGRAATFSILVLACIVGLPARLALTAQRWRDRDYRPVMSFVAKHVTPADWVYCDYSAYYPIKPVARWTILRPYLERISPEEKASVSALIIRPEQYDEVQSVIGGTWRVVDRYTSGSTESSDVKLSLLRTAAPYDLVVYRRE